MQKNIRKGHQKTVDDVISYVKNYPELTSKTFCDAGCGVGSLAIPLLGLGIKDLQVSDISSEMIKETKKRIKEKGFTVVQKKLNQAPFYFSKLIEFKKVK